MKMFGDKSSRRSLQNPYTQQAPQQPVSSAILVDNQRPPSRSTRVNPLSQGFNQMQPVVNNQQRAQNPLVNSFSFQNGSQVNNLAGQSDIHKEYHLLQDGQSGSRIMQGQPSNTPFRSNGIQDSRGSLRLGNSQSYSGIQAKNSQQIRFESFAGQSGNNTTGMTPKFSGPVNSFSSAQVGQNPYVAPKTTNYYTVPLKGEGGVVVPSNTLRVPNQITGQPQAPYQTNNPTPGSNNLLANPRVQNGYSSSARIQPNIQTSTYPEQITSSPQDKQLENMTRSPIMKAAFLHKGEPKTSIDGLYAGLAGNNFDFSKAPALRGSEFGLVSENNKLQNNDEIIRKFRSPEIGQIETAWDSRPSFDKFPNGEFKTLKEDHVFIPSNHNMNKLDDIYLQKETMESAQSSKNLLEIAKRVRDMQYGFQTAMNNEGIDLNQVMLIEQYKRNSILEDNLGPGSSVNNSDVIPPSGRVDHDDPNKSFEDSRKSAGLNTSEVNTAYIVRLWTNEIESEPRDRGRYR